MPLMLALVVRVELHYMNGIDVPYVGSFCETTTIGSISGTDAPHVGSCCESTSIRSINGTDAPYVVFCCER